METAHGWEMRFSCFFRELVEYFEIRQYNEIYISVSLCKDTNWNLIDN